MKKRILSMLLFCSALVSCQNYFDIDSERSDLPEWQSVTDLTGMLAASYKVMFTNGGWANPLANTHNYTELVHDLGVINPGGSWTFGIDPNARTNYPFDQSEYQLGYAINGIYISISCTNTLIAFIDEVEAGNIAIMSALSTSDLTELSRIKGEAYFMRGFAYYLLSLLYMPPYSDENSETVYLPYIVERYYTAEELLSPPMGTMGMVYDLMVSDFTIARSELESIGQSDSDIQTTRRGYANKYAAAAMLMRLYFVQQNWSAALEQITYIEKGPYDLSEQPIRGFNRNYDSSYPVANEVIFDCVLTGTGSTANSQPALNRITKIGSFSTAINKVIDLTDPNWVMGGRDENWLHQQSSALYWNTNVLRDIGWAEDNVEAPGDVNRFQLTAEAEADLRCSQLHYYLKLYKEGGDQTEHEMYYTSTYWDALWNDKYLRAPNAQYSQLPLIRYAEVVLTKASCLVQSGGSNADAVTAINTIRERAYGSSAYNFTGTVTEDVVEIERIKELAFELGDRLRYLAAMKRDIPSNGKKTDPSQASDVPVIPYPYNGFHIELPDYEIDYSSSAWEALDNY
ncbi:MAG: RagB/SusD family nutrient uptake outer membrane protein [Rikenellaceae bacterium]